MFVTKNDVISLFDHTFVYISGLNPLLGYGLCERTLLLKVNEPVSSKKESDSLGREQKAHVHSKSGCCK